MPVLTGAQKNLHEHQEEFIRLAHARTVSRYEGVVQEFIATIRREGEALQEKARRLGETAAELTGLAETVQSLGDPDLDEQKTDSLLENGAGGLTALAEYYRRKGETRLIEADSWFEEARSLGARRQVSQQLTNRLQQDIDSVWPRLQIPSDFSALLTDKPLMLELGRDLFAEEEIGLMARAISAPKDVQAEDLAAIATLYSLANGSPPQFKHIIVDEAQDVSPLQFDVIRRHSQNGSITILGDLAQSIYGHRGVTSWDQIREVFPDSKFAYKEIRRSYRNTYEIMTYATRILRHLIRKGSEIPLPEPFERHDKQPTVEIFDTRRASAKAVAKTVHELERQGHTNVAIILRTRELCFEWQEVLRVEGVNIRTIIEPQSEYNGGVVLLPVYLSKGLEFEAVILVDADVTTYSDSDLNTHLLYVATTRALHELYIYGVGKLARQLSRERQPSIA